MTSDYSSNPRSYGSLEAVRSILSEHPGHREKLLDCLIEIENALQPGSNRNLREELTGPLVDLMCRDGEPMQRGVAGGLTFHFRYSSKIARDFLLARGRTPDHVWEPQTTRSVIALTTGRSQALIGGAYIGDHALYAARALAPGGTCHCFELSPDSLELLRMNLQANGITNVRVNQEALWSGDGERIALSGADSHASPAPAEAASGDWFPSRSIDGYLRDMGVARLDLLMLDIEGGEWQALQGAAGVLAQPTETAPAVIFEVHRNYVDWTHGLAGTPICGLLLSQGYELFCIRDYQGNEVVEPPVVELVDIESVVLDGPPHGFNMLAVKTRDRLAADTFRLVRGVSPKLLKHRDPRLHAPAPDRQERL